MKRRFALLLLALLPMVTFAQRYEGERNKKGEPDGQGVMYFEPVIDGIAYTERIEGTFKKGVPVKGKYYRYYKDSWRPKIKFEGKFKLKQKGVFSKSGDLKMEGYGARYFYDNSINYDRYGYNVSVGTFVDHKIIEGYFVSTKEGKTRDIVRGELNGYYHDLNGEAWAYYNELAPEFWFNFYFNRLKEKEDRQVIFLNQLKPAKATMMWAGCFNVQDGEERKQNYRPRELQILWLGNTVDGLIDGEGCGLAYHAKRDDYDYENSFLFYGEFKRGVPVKSLICNQVGKGWTGHYIVDKQADNTTLVAEYDKYNKLRNEFAISADYKYLGKTERIKEKERASADALFYGFWGLVQGVASIGGGTSQRQNEIDSRPVPSYNLRDFNSNSKPSEVVRMWSVEFSDGLLGVAYYHVSGGKNWYTYDGYSHTYKTLDDAIKAYYIKKKFGEVRMIGYGVNKR